MSVIYEALAYPEKNFPVVFHTDYRKNHEGPVDVPMGMQVKVYDNNRQSIHWHESLEVLRVREGIATVRMNEQLRQVKPGEIAVVNANTLHNVFSSGRSCLYDCLILSSEACREWGFPVTETMYAYQFRDTHISRLLDGISREFCQQKECYKPLVVAKCIELMAWLTRSHRLAEGEPSHGEKKTVRVQNMIRYIQKHYEEPLTLEGLSEEFGYSRFYLAHTFSEMTGMSVMDYLQQVRMRAACRLLADEEKTVTEIAEACGYANVSSFSTAFRKRHGQSPSHYRQTMRRGSDGTV